MRGLCRFGKDGCQGGLSIVAHRDRFAEIPPDMIFMFMSSRRPREFHTSAMCLSKLRKSVFEVQLDPPV